MIYGVVFTTLNTMTTPLNTDKQPPEHDVPTPEQQTALDILTDMAARYQQAKTYFEDTRDGLAEAARDAKIHGLTPAQIMKITGWSRTQVHSVTRQFKDRTPADTDVNTKENDHAEV